MEVILLWLALEPCCSSAGTLTLRGTEAGSGMVRGEGSTKRWQRVGCLVDIIIENGYKSITHSHVSRELFLAWQELIGDLVGRP